MYSKTTRRPGVLLLCIAVVAVFLASPQISSGALAASAVTIVQSETSAPSTEPKCVFLREQLTRVEAFEVNVPQNIPANIRASYVSNVEEVGSNIARENVNSCDENEQLISAPRMSILEAARLNHVRRIRGAFEGNGADLLVEAVNGAYEQEAQSFYNQETVGLPIFDRDVVKDFPTFLDLLIASDLPEELKVSFQENIRFIRYEEAGRLQNALMGIDLDSGTTFAFLLRTELADRSSQAAERLRINNENQTANLEALEKSAVLQARITLSISFLVIVGLVCFMLIRREVMEMEHFINVGVVCFLICAGWILVTLGAWEWLQGYMGVAF